MQLRRNLLLDKDVDRFGDPIVVICDPLVRRYFSLPVEAEPVLERLRTPTEFSELVADFHELFGEEELGGMVEGLALNLLFEEGLDPDALRSELRDRHRSEQWASLQRTLRHAAEQIPIYRQSFAASDVRPDVQSPTELLRAPYLTKAHIREHYPDGFLPDGTDLDAMLARKELRLATSSGTAAGDRLQMIFSAEARGLQMAAGTSLNEQLAALAKHHQAVLTSMHCADPDVCVRYSPELSERVRDGNRLLLIPPDDPGTPTVEEVHRIFGELRSFGVRWLDGNPTYLANLTYAALDEGIELPRLEAITCSYEFLIAHHRKLFERVWGCPVYVRYTASEVGNYQIIECPHRTLHVNDRYFYPEIVRDGGHVAPGEVGRLVQTTLQELVPLVRYDTGDLFVAADDRQCACGSVSQIVGAIAGRATDLVAATDGTPCTTRQIDVALSTVEGYRFYQLTQTTSTDYRLKLVLERNHDTATVHDQAAAALRAVLGARAGIRIEGARHVYPEPSGKFRVTRSELPNPEGMIRLT